MSQQIETHRIDKFGADIMHLAQQRGSVFLGQAPGMGPGMALVDVDMDVKAKRAFYDQLGATVAQELTTRHADTQYTDTPHRRRMLSARRFGVADLVDEDDVEQVSQDPSAKYAEAFAWAIGRAVDDRVIAAFFATANVGEDGTDTAAHPASHQIAAGAAGITIDKLRQAREILEASEEPEDDMNPWFIATTARQRRDLLSTTEITSLDFNERPTLVNGEIVKFLGFTFVKSQRLGLVGAERAIPVWTRTSMKLGFRMNFRGSIDVLPGKNHSTQIAFRASFGATRMRETGVVRILATES